MNQLLVLLLLCLSVAGPLKAKTKQPKPKAPHASNPGQQGRPRPKTPASVRRTRARRPQPA